MNRTHYFVRHGRSTANVGLRTSDETQVDLAPEGREQAKQAAAALRGKVRRIVSSSYPRALQTAAPLAESSGLVPEIWPIHEFFYLNPELCRNTNQRERGKMRAEFWGMLDPEWRHCPQSESFCDLLARIETFRGRMLALPEDTAIYGHGQFGMVYLITLHFPNHSPRHSWS